MNRMQGIAVLVWLLLLTTSASAHSQIMGIGGVVGGVLHALLIPEHGMSLVALGVALGRQEQEPRRYAAMVFIVAMTAGMVAIGLAAESSFAADALLAATAILGLLIAAAWLPPLLVWPLAGVVGVAFALDSPPEVNSTDETIRMLVGSGIGAAMALAVLAEGSSHLRSIGPRIAARVLGSWIAAIAILDLSLRIATRLTTGAIS